MENDFSSHISAVAPPWHRPTDKISAPNIKKYVVYHYTGNKFSRPIHYFDIVKYMGDTLLSLTGCFFLLPLFIILALLLFLTSKQNPFFLQTRVGKNGKHFRIIKFKTMNDRRDRQGNLLPDDQRLTKMGDFLRKTSLDELPQLLNVIKGDMSLIGPRPWIPEQVAQFSVHEQRCRSRVKPGITGLAQVYGRNALTFRERLPYDVWYVRYQSLRVDAMILWKTVGKVLRRDGIRQRVDALVKFTSCKNRSEEAPY